MSSPRRICPACARRYAGLVPDDCPVCEGLGVLGLGAAALHTYEPAAVARAVELYLEQAAQDATRTVPLGDRPGALAAATDELRLAGVLAGNLDTYTRSPRHTLNDAQATTVSEASAHHLATTTGRPPSRRTLAALHHPPVPSLTPHRPRNGAVPTASTNGHLAALAVVADPIDPLGPDVAILEDQARAHTYRARVIAAAVPDAADRRRPTTRPPILVAVIADLRLEDLKRTAKAAGIPPVNNKTTLAIRLAEAGHQLTPTG